MASSLAPRREALPAEARIGASGRRWLAAHERGSVIAVSDDTGAAIAKNTYDEFGMPDAGNLGRFQYTGQIWLPEVGLYHYKARTYASGIGRFLQTNPIGYDDQMNLYAYVGNDPVNGVDPGGEYGKGSGWTEPKWDKFNRAQQVAARRAEGDAADLRKAAGKLRAGKIDGTTRGVVSRFEKSTGVAGTAEETAGRMEAAASALEKSAAALRDDGTEGYFADAVTAEQWKEQKYPEDAAARAEVGGKRMTINGGHRIFKSQEATGSRFARSDTRLPWMVGHEALHSAGLWDQRADSGFKAYRYGLPDERKTWKELPKEHPERAVINPDNILAIFNR